MHLDTKSFSDAIQAASQNLKIREVFIEKDYWVCFLLKNLSLSSANDKVVFKGGTSLSKAYGCIHRFSEDVDLALISPDAKDNQIKKMIKEVEEKIAIAPLVEVAKTGITSKGSRFRKTAWKFEATRTGDYGDASPELIIEINSFAKPSPVQKMPIRTYIADFLIGQGNQKEITEFGLEDVSVQILNYKRTFAEKVAAIARACFESESDLNEAKKKIRHIYDLTMLMRISEIQKFVAGDEFVKVYQQVQSDDRGVSAKQKGVVEKNWKDAKVFKSTKEAMKVLADTYHGQLSTLVFDVGTMPPLSEAEKAMILISRAE